MPSDREYPARPIVGVGAVIVVSAADAGAVGWAEPLGAATGVVLVKRRFEPLAGQWSLPGGTLEVGETLTAGIAREVAEETGLTVDVGPIIEVFDRIFFDEADEARRYRTKSERATASEPRERSAPTKRRARARVRESEGRSPSVETRRGQPARAKYHFVLIDYLCRPIRGQLRPGSDVSEVTIAAPDGLTRFALTAKTLEVIGKALASRKDTDGDAVAG